MDSTIVKLSSKCPATQPPLTKGFADTVSQWCIFDAYMDDIKEQEEAAKRAAEGKKGGDIETKKKGSESDPIYSEAMRLSIKLMERMVLFRKYRS